MTFVRARDHTRAVFDQDDDNLFNLTSTTYTSEKPVVGVRFTAPTSGNVVVAVGGGSRDNASGTQRAYLAPYIINAIDENSVALSPDNVGNAMNPAPETTKYWFGQRQVIVTGLTAGQRYIARVRSSVDGGSSCDVNVRDILVEPIP